MNHDYEDAVHDQAEAYGRHSHAHAPGPSALELLAMFVQAGQAIRLAWSSGPATADEHDGYPTAILPTILEPPS